MALVHFPVCHSFVTSYRITYKSEPERHRVLGGEIACQNQEASSYIYTHPTAIDLITGSQNDMNDRIPHLTTGHLNRNRTLIFLASALAFLYLRTFLLPGTPLIAQGDQVIYFAHGIRMLHGQLPFRDFFTFVLPGTDLFYACVFGLFGVHAWLPPTFLILLGLTVVCLLLWISKSILSGMTAFLPPLLFLVLDFDSALDATHHWYSTIFVLAATGTLLGGRSARRVLTAGVFCGIAAIFTQTQGTLSLIAISFFLIVTRRTKEQEGPLSKQLVLLALPFVTIVGGLLGYYVYAIGLHPLFYDLGTFLFKYFSAQEAHRPAAYFMQIPQLRKLTDLASVTQYGFIHLFVPFAYFFGLFRLVREKRQMDPKLWEAMLLINLTGLAIFAAVVNGPTYHRLSMIAPPAIIVAVWLFDGASTVNRTVRALLWSTAVVLLISLPAHLQLHWRGYVDLPIGRAATPDRVRYDEFQQFAGRVHAGESFFGSPQLSFNFSLDNPTQMDVVTPNEFTRPEQVDGVVHALANNRTPLISLYPEIYFSHGAGDNLGPFRDYIHQNYHQIQVFHSGQIWERN
jgi:hypothetical protein